MPVKMLSKDDVIPPSRNERGEAISDDPEAAIDYTRMMDRLSKKSRESGLIRNTRKNTRK